MTVRLRPHHLLCLLTYAGKGYSPGFTANYDSIAERIARGEDILIVAGPDDICAPLLDDREPHCWQASVTERDVLAARDLGRLLAMPIRTGTQLSLERHGLRRMRAAFAEGSLRQACAGCEWSTLCTSIASDAFRGVAIPDR
ncbi:DUF1284 domain-containing protein [Aquibium sp. A9E412]|uniref:DUF1284 domain-containing protein n=1 Tax=Aquibium sp. A9E412 TaxID=2976767 RepID=UPI0025B268AF|nr:DUF1284 domain-containing protein [Aquibium sp. A9E412]MDN2567312.1 DUF1284 domain-containing protein [Aquibium sp. A9E412]